MTTKKKTVKKKAVKKKPVKKVAQKSVAKKKPAKKTSKKKAVKISSDKIKVIRGQAINLSKEKPVGAIVHYYGKIKVGVIEIHKGQQVAVGEILYFSGNTTDFDDTLSSMQEYGKPINVAKGKKQVGVKVKKKVRQGDKVFSITKV